jgi:bacillithiol biosynthesis deacetylase BshB1
MSAVDALFVGAHPDDIELCCAGLAARLAAEGFHVAICDLTRGEAASRGSVEVRAAEAAEAARILGIGARENLALPDTGLNARDRAQLAAVVALLRRRRPSLLLAPDPRDEHPDHVEGAQLVARAAYLAGLARYPAPGEAFRPDLVLHAVYRDALAPDVIVDVSEHFERRMAALRAHRSQLGLDGAAGPETYLTREGFLGEVEARARVLGARIGVRFGEGFRVSQAFPVWNTAALLRRVTAGVGGKNA